jgi:hypothetical protein
MRCYRRIMRSESGIALGVAAVLVALSGLHVYWGAGGRWGLGGVLPEVQGKQALRAGPLACAVVALLLASAAGLVAAGGGCFVAPLPNALVTLACWGVTLTFTLRVVGDFRYFGLFRRVRGTAFARNDARIFTPLCLVLAAACAWVALGA